MDSNENSAQCILSALLQLVGQPVAYVKQWNVWLMTDQPTTNIKLQVLTHTRQTRMARDGVYNRYFMGITNEQQKVLYSHPPTWTEESGTAGHFVFTGFDVAASAEKR